MSKRFLIPILLLMLAACNQQHPPGGNGVTGVVIQAPNTLASQERVNLSATVKGTGTFDNDVSWSVTGGGTFTNAKANPVAYTAPAVTKDTVVTIKASSVEDPTKFAIASVTVKTVEPLTTVVKPDVKPAQPALPDSGGFPRPLGASRDDKGVQSDFVLGEALLHPDSSADLQAFLDRFGAKVLADNAVPEPPASLGVTLTPADRKATEYLVRFDLSKVDLANLKDNAAKVGLGGLLELSSEDALRTLAGITDAAAAGFEASPNFANYPDQAFPRPLFKTSERGGANAFTAPNNFQATGSQSNVTLAWQFVAARGVARRARVAIIDGGFWLDGVGNPLTAAGDGSDLPQNPIQYDFANDDHIAGAMNPAQCGRSDCPWHGNGSAGVATGIVDNAAAAAGTGGLVADPMLFHTDIRDSAQRSRAVRTAVAWGADVINMSFGGLCNYWCRWGERLFLHSDEVFRDANARGVVLVASAGNSGIDVVDDNYIHPCLNDSVICVGALTDGSNTAFDTRSSGGWASNFGSGVDIWAPTNIQAMANGGSSNALINFNGTSASAPFVSGVAAMMKAIDPSLNSDQVNQILRDTAHRGAAPVDFYIDAYAAVRKAAEGIEGVKDRFEPNGANNPHNLTGSGPWDERNLNLHSVGDSDFFGFDSRGLGIVTVNLHYPEVLGEIPGLGLTGATACPPILLDDTVATDSHELRYSVAFGPQVFGLGGGLISAYDLLVSLGQEFILNMDRYEHNDSYAEAADLSRRYPLSIGGLQYDVGLDPAAFIEANLNTSSDVDWYMVRGVNVNPGAGRGYLDAHPTVRVTGNESVITLEVFTVDQYGAPGVPFTAKTSSKCDGSDLSVQLEPGQSYFAKVSGSAGHYSLHNGVSWSWHQDRVPLIIQRVKNIWEYLRPDGPRPNELIVRYPISFGFIADRTVRELGVSGNVRLELFNADGDLLAERVHGGGFDHQVDLSGLEQGEFYALALTPIDPGEEGTRMQLSWSGVEPSRKSANLIVNPGADIEMYDDPEFVNYDIEGWSRTREHGTAVAIHYLRVGDPVEGPNPEVRGSFLFSGGPIDPGEVGVGLAQTAVMQVVDVPDDWRSAVDGGLVSASLSAFLGGFLDQHDGATVTLAFLDGSARELSRTTLGPVTHHERGGETGLWPVAAHSLVPNGSVSMEVTILFAGDVPASYYGLADNLELTLLEYAQ